MKTLDKIINVGKKALLISVFSLPFIASASAQGFGNLEKPDMQRYITKTDSYNLKRTFSFNTMDVEGFKEQNHVYYSGARFLVNLKDDKITKHNLYGVVVSQAFSDFVGIGLNYLKPRMKKFKKELLKIGGGIIGAHAFFTFIHPQETQDERDAVGTGIFLWGSYKLIKAIIDTKDYPKEEVEVIEFGPEDNLNKFRLGYKKTF
jgi:hypothetical protein